MNEKLCEKYGVIDGSPAERLRYWIWAMYECPSEKTGQGNEGEILVIVREVAEMAHREYSTRKQYGRSFNECFDNILAERKSK